MNWQELRAVARGYAYSLLECSPYINQLTSKELAYGVTASASTSSIVESMFRNQMVEFWHCVHRKFYVEGPHVGERIVKHEDIDNAIANTRAWLKWYQRGGHKQNLEEMPEEDRIPMPEWGKEYI